MQISRLTESEHEERTSFALEIIAKWNLRFKAFSFVFFDKRKAVVEDRALHLKSIYSQCDLSLKRYQQQSRLQLFDSGTSRHCSKPGVYLPHKLDCSSIVEVHAHSAATARRGTGYVEARVHSLWETGLEARVAQRT